MSVPVGCLPELKVGDHVDVRVKLDIRKDDEYNGNRGWVQGRITKVSACEADINLISMKDRTAIIKAYEAEIGAKADMTAA